MKLTRAKVENYKSIEDSGWVEFDQITCLVGKNESGKTAFLQAIEKINPVDGSHADFDYVYDYPAAKYTTYKRQHDTEPAPVVTVEFELEPGDKARLESLYGSAINRDTFTVTKKYDNSTSWDLQLDEVAALQFVAAKAKGASDALDAAIDAATSGQELLDAIAAHGEDVQAAQDVAKRINGWTGKSVWQGAVRTLRTRLPKFFYFDDYSVMQGRISLDDLIRRLDADGTIEDSERPFLALLAMIGAKPQDLRDETHSERLTRELEGASVHMTDEMARFWKQNEQLEVRFQIDQANPDDPAPLNAGKVLSVRIYNPHHRASVPFGQRSKGFVWFFSFLVFFQQLEENRDSNARTILLLDEPALSLHALAQRHFLDFMDQRLAPDYQVVYTTHSPFMVEPTKLEQVRTVYDRGKDVGTVVSSEVYRTDSDTLFPLQAALGYDMAQTLFVGPDCLLVEGPSDLIYLDFLSAAVADNGGEALNERWVVVPVGGADKLYTFVSLLGGNQLNAVALMDVSKRDAQRIKNLQDNGHLPTNGLIEVSEFTSASEADIEDIFEPAFYLKLVNGAYSGPLPKKLTQTALGKGDPRIIKRIENYFADNAIGNGQFSHFQPARYLSRNVATLASELDTDTLTGASEIFKRVNALLS